MPPPDEGLVELVSHGVRGGEHECRRGASRGAEDQAAENCVLRHMGELPQDGVPGAQARAELGYCRDREDEAGPEDDRDPGVETGGGHGLSVARGRDAALAPARRWGSWKFLPGVNGTCGKS